MRHVYTTIVFGSCLLTTSCLPLKQLQMQQQANLLNAQIQQTSQVLAQLKKTPNPESASQFSVFVPVAALNEVFSKADGLSFEPQNLNNVRIVLNQFRANFNAGCSSGSMPCVSALPYLDFSVSACTLPPRAGSPCGDITVTLQTTAYLDIVPQSVNGLPGQATVSVQIVDVVPNVQIGIFDFALRGFVQQLIKVNLAQLVAQNVPPMTIPVQINNHIAYKGGPIPANIPTPNGGSAILGNILTPSFAKDVSLQVQSILFLPDGVHMYLLAN